MQSSLSTKIGNILNFYQLKSDEMEHCQMPFVRDHMWKEYLEDKREFQIVLPLDVILEYESLEMHLAFTIMMILITRMLFFGYMIH